MSWILVVVAAICGALSAALMSPGLLAVAVFALAGSLICDGIAARNRKKQEVSRWTR